jgi:hypothetical protein
MHKILLVTVAALSILGIFANGCGIIKVRVLAPIHDIDVWADNSSPPRYFLYVVSGEPTTCSEFGSYNVTRSGNTIRAEIFNLRSVSEPCGEIYSYVEHTIPLGSDLVPAVNYTIEINDVTVSFVAGVIMIYRAAILGIEIWADQSLPPQYFADVLSEEDSTCDQFDSYNVTHVGNTTIIVDIFNRRCCTGCPDPNEMYDYNYARRSVPLGRHLVPGMNYTVVVNNVTEVFVAWG